MRGLYRLRPTKQARRSGREVETSCKTKCRFEMRNDELASFNGQKMVKLLSGLIVPRLEAGRGGGRGRGRGRLGGGQFWNSERKGKYKWIVNFVCLCSFCGLFAVLVFFFLPSYIFVLFYVLLYFLSFFLPSYSLLFPSSSIFHDVLHPIFISLSLFLNFLLL